MKSLHLSLIVLLITTLLVTIYFNNKINAFTDNGTDNWIVQNITGKFLYSNPLKSDQTFAFQYRVSNGVLGNFTVNPLGYYTAKVSSVLPTTFELKIPKNYPYSNIGRPIISVLVNGNNLDQQQYSFTSTDCFFEFSIPFSGESNIALSFASHPAEEPFHGDTVPKYCIDETTVPEFPLAIPILLIGITSLIIFHKMKIRI